MRQNGTILFRSKNLGEHNLAKVGVEGSNPFARSKFPLGNQSVMRRPPQGGLSLFCRGVHMVSTAVRPPWLLGPSLRHSERVKTLSLGRGGVLWLIDRCRDDLCIGRGAGALPERANGNGGETKLLSARCAVASMGQRRSRTGRKSKEPRETPRGIRLRDDEDRHHQSAAAKPGTRQWRRQTCQVSKAPFVHVVPS